MVRFAFNPGGTSTFNYSMSGKKEKKNRFIVLNILVLFVYPFMLSASARQSVCHVRCLLLLLFHSLSCSRPRSVSLAPAPFSVSLAPLRLSLSLPRSSLPIALSLPLRASLLRCSRRDNSTRTIFHAWAATFFRRVHAYFPADDSANRAPWILSATRVHRRVCGHTQRRNR